MNATFFCFIFFIRNERTQFTNTKAEEKRNDSEKSPHKQNNKSLKEKERNDDSFERIPALNESIL